MNQKETQKKKDASKSLNSKLQQSNINPESKAGSNVKKSIESDKKTRIIVQYDAGFSNKLFLRGQGIPNVNWEKGIELKNIKADEWVWETDKPISNCQFKILINDKTYEIGENHTLFNGSSIRINPKFPSA